MSGCIMVTVPSYDASIAPALERVRVRNVPVAEIRRLVGVETVVDRQADLGELLGELQVRRRGEDRVDPAEDHQHLDLAGIHRRDQIASEAA